MSLHPVAATLRNLLTGLMLLLLSTAIGAQPNETTAKVVKVSAEASASVVLNGEVLFRVLGVTSYPADKRAAVITGRIEKLARDPAFDPATLTMVNKGDYVGIMAGELLVVGLVREDAMLEGLDHISETLVSTYLDRVRAAIITYRYERQPDVLLRAVLYAVGATIALIALAYGLVLVFRHIDRLLEQRFKHRLEALEVKSLRVVQAQQVWAALSGGVKAVRILSLLMLLYVYLNSVLVLLPWTRGFARVLLGYVTDPLLQMWQGFMSYLPKLFFLIVLVIIARFMLKLSRVFFDAVGEGRVSLSNFEREWADPTYRILRFLFLAFVLVIAYPYIPGSDSDAFKGVSLFLGVLFSLGSSSVLSNVIAGYTMTYRRAFKNGDRVCIDGVTGDVAEMSVLVTHLVTPKNERVVIPNSKILNTEVVNYSAMARDRGLILHTVVGIGYEVSWRQVEAMLLMAAERTPGLKAGSQAFVLQKSLGDFAVNYELNVYCDDALRMNQLYTELHRNIQDVFNEYGVQIMTPAYEGDTPDPKIVPKDQWFAAPARPPEAAAK